MIINPAIEQLQDLLFTERVTHENCFFPLTGRQTKEPVSKLYKQCSWQAKHKEEVSLLRNFQIDCLENQTSPKKTVVTI